MNCALRQFNTVQYVRTAPPAGKRPSFATFVVTASTDLTLAHVYCESQYVMVVTVFYGGMDGWASCGFVSPSSLAPWFFPCLWCMPYEPSLARAL